MKGRRVEGELENCNHCLSTVMKICLCKEDGGGGGVIKILKMCLRDIRMVPKQESRPLYSWINRRKFKYNIGCFYWVATYNMEKCKVKQKQIETDVFTTQYTANIFEVIFTVFNCVPISTVISLYGLHFIAAPSTV